MHAIISNTPHKQDFIYTLQNTLKSHLNHNQSFTHNLSNLGRSIKTNQSLYIPYQAHPSLGLRSLELWSLVTPSLLRGAHVCFCRTARTSKKRACRNKISRRRGRPIKINKNGDKGNRDTTNGGITQRRGRRRKTMQRTKVI